ncbi:MAG: Na/Pi cotransporter family protein [Lachnospiraceae bacterium]|nr:Na/Pi cotransporter family protein [Lachnospiraceae bacterium]
MSISDVGMLFKFVGGIGFFLYGMHIMADGLQKAAGNRMKSMLGFFTKNRFVAVVMGALITALLQSSTATTVMTVGFVNAGMLTLKQAVGVIMGANIGTTFTAWLVSLSELGMSFKPEFIAPLFVGLGAFGVLFSKSEQKKKIGEIIVGFGVLFIGFGFMSEAIAPYKNAQIFYDTFSVLGNNPILAILSGIVVTAIMHSSAASVGILQTLAMNGIVTWQSAVFITLGQNIGTCITAVYSGAGASTNAKRASILHLLFNVFGAIWCGILAYIIFRFRADIALKTISSVDISIFHTVFNTSNTIILFPLAGVMVRFSEKLIREKPVALSEDETIESARIEEVRRHLDRRILKNPSFAIETGVQQVLAMADIARTNFYLALEAFNETEKESAKAKEKQVVRTENTINELEKMLTEFLVDVDNLSLTEEQHSKVKTLFYMIIDAERIGDHSENVAELAKKKRKEKITFSDKSEKDLEKMIHATSETLDGALAAYKQDDKTMASIAKQCEEGVDALEKKLRDKHISRLSKGKCEPTAGVLFLDLLVNLERVADHADNIAGYVLGEEAP